MIRVSYRPEEQVCPICKGKLKRDHIVWRKRVTFSSGERQVTSWAYRCASAECANAAKDFRSVEAEKLHLKQRRFSRELIVRIGHRRFWQHQTMYEIHEWLTQDIHLQICKREVTNLLADFLALLSAAQPAKIRQKLNSLKDLIIGVTLLAENLEESSQEALCERIFEPLKELAKELELDWHGVVSDAQETIRLAVAQSLKGVPHQACQSHCLRDAGKLTFEADRAMKTDIKASFRHTIPRYHSN
jgi:hypothetical protein